MRARPIPKMLPPLLLGLLAAAFAMPGSASAASCPTWAKQRTSTRVSFDSTCVLTASDWRSLGGSTSTPPVATAWQMSIYKTKPPYRNRVRMMNLMKAFDGRDCDPRTCRGMTPGSAGRIFNRLQTGTDPPIDTEGSPAIKPICPRGYVISSVPRRGGGRIVRKYTCVCYMWTSADIDNPLFPPDLAAIIAAGGYIPPTQYCILVPMRLSRSRVPAFQPADPAAVIPAAASPPTARAAASPTYSFRQVVPYRPGITLAKRGDRISCGLKPMVALSKIMVRDPLDSSQNVVAGTGMGAICRLKIVRVRTPRLTAAQRRLVRKGNVAIAFKVIGLPSIGTRERARAMPYAAVKIFGISARPANGNRYRMVQANSRGVAVWIGKFSRTATYTARAAWPFYQYACTRFRFRKTPQFTG